MPTPPIYQIPPQFRHILKKSTHFNLLPPLQFTNMRWSSDPPYNQRRESNRKYNANQIFIKSTPWSKYEPCSSTPCSNPVFSFSYQKDLNCSECLDIDEITSSNRFNASILYGDMYFADQNFGAFYRSFFKIANLQNIDLKFSALIL